METILLIDDDRELGDLLREYLEPEGFLLERALDGPGGLEAASSGRHDLVLLDVMLPGRSGFDVLRDLRRRSSVPVLMLTARGEDVDRIVGLEMGADDYLPKPFNPRELLARIRAVLRRGGREGSESREGLLRAEDLELDRGSRTVRREGVPVPLTTVEFDLLELLLQSAGQGVDRERLSQGALKRPHSPFDRSLDVHVSNLRRKLGPRRDGTDRIRTLRGEGYLYAL